MQHDLLAQSHDVPRMERQGVLQTLCVMTTTAVLGRLLLTLLAGGSLIR